MLTATGSLAQLRSHYSGEARDLFRVLINSTSTTEANLALQLLREDHPEKPLVIACNLREVLRTLPTSPFAMRVDENVLAKSAGLERGIASFGKELPDGLELSITTAGNLVLDVIVRQGDEKYFWNPVPVVDDFVCPDVLDLCVYSEYLLNAVIALTEAMGVVFNPRFYLSLEDWYFDNVADAFGGLEELF